MHLGMDRLTVQSGKLDRSLPLSQNGTDCAVAQPNQASKTKKLLVAILIERDAGLIVQWNKGK